MDNQAWLLGQDACPSCGEKEFKLTSTRYSVSYYMPLESENHILCLHCNWKTPVSDLSPQHRGRLAKHLIKKPSKR